MSETGVMFNNSGVQATLLSLVVVGVCQCISLCIFLARRGLSGQSLPQPGRGEEETAGKEDSRFSKGHPYSSYS